MKSQNLTIDTVKEEMANAMATYRRFRNFKFLFQAIELLVVLTVLTWSSTCLPAVVKLPGEFLLRLSIYLLNPHVVFVIGNAIIVALFVLSRHIDLGDDSAAGYDIYGDYEEAIEIPNSSITEMKSSPPTIDIAADETSEKQIVCVENAVSETEYEAIGKATKKKIQKFERAQSEKMRSEASPKDLRRSETEVRRSVISDDIEKVESLSNDEFRLTVEAFIQKQLEFLRQQKMAEIDSLQY